MVTQVQRDVQMPEQTLQLTSDQAVYLVGIGGAGMSSLAQLLLAVGCPVSGSDSKDSATLQLLQAQGATISVGHRGDQVPANALVVYSSAVADTNPERQIASQRGQTQWHRSDLLKALLQGPLPGFKTTIGISGTHGKTTLTGMLGQVLTLAALEPTVIAGGRLPGQSGNVQIGSRFDVAVAELDESDGTIVQYTPTITLLANLELDHADHYQSGVAGLEATFTQYLEQLVDAMTQDGQPRMVIANADCPLSRQVCLPFLKQIKLLWLGFEPCSPEIPVNDFYQIQPEPQPDELGRLAGQLTHQGQPVLSLKTGVPGRHNLFNACLTAVSALQLGVSPEVIARAVLGFTGMGRRFERVGTLHGALLVDDYAHHPTEVRETCKAARAVVGSSGRLWAIFQPHRVTRLQALWDDFVAAFDEPDQVLLLDIYRAGEAPIDTITSARLAEQIAARRPNVRYCDSFKAAEQILTQEVTAGDLVLAMGAGDSTRLLREHPDRQPLEDSGQ